MDNYITGSIIKKIREEKKKTQLELANELMISEKTISKWETGKGLPDISMIEPLAKALNVSIIELFNGIQIKNSNKCANIKKIKFYVCPMCGNVIQSLGEGVYNCCGINLPELEAEETNDVIIEKIENELFISIENEMSKENYISFICMVGLSKVQFVKLYPEQACETRFGYEKHGIIYYYSNRNGLFSQKF